MIFKTDDIAEALAGKLVEMAKSGTSVREAKQDSIGSGADGDILPRHVADFS